MSKSNTPQTDYLDTMPQSSFELDAWQVMCRVLKARGVDVNEDREVTASIAAWGKYFMDLRDAQDCNADPLFYSMSEFFQLKEKYPADGEILDAKELAPDNQINQ